MDRGHQPRGDRSRRTADRRRGRVPAAPFAALVLALAPGAVAAPPRAAIAEAPPPDPAPPGPRSPEAPPPGRALPRLAWLGLPPEQVPAASPVTLAVTAQGLPEGAVLRVRFRPTGAPHWVERELTPEPGGPWTGALPAFPVEPGEPPRRIELYVDAVGPDGERIASLGGPGSPLSFVVTPLPEAARAVPVWYANPWVWTGAAVVVGSVVGTVLLLTEAPHEGSLPVRVRVP